MTNLDTNESPKKRGRKPKVVTIGEAIPTSVAVIKAQPKNFKQDELELMVENLKVRMRIDGKTLDEALEMEDLSRKSIPVWAYKQLLKQSLEVKRELFDIPPDVRSSYVRAADFETYMKAVENGDTNTQATFSKILRQDSELGMEAQKPSLMLNLGALKEIFAATPTNSPEIIDAEIINPENDKIKERTE